MISDIVRALVAAGASPEMILGAVEAAERAQTSKEQERLLKQRERTRRWRGEHTQPVTSRDVTEEECNVTSHHVTSHPAPPKETSPGPPKEITPTPVFASRIPCAREDTAGFEEFWTAYPNKVGKPAARLKFQKALEKAGLADILAGLQRYIRAKPGDREWLNPATFLHQERWADQPLFANGHSATGPPSKPMTGSAKMVELLKKPLDEIYGRNGNSQPPEPTFRTIRNG